MWSTIFRTIILGHRRFSTGNGVSVHIMYQASKDFLYGPSGAGRGQPVQRLLGGCHRNRCDGSVELPCIFRSLQTVIERRPCRIRAKAARTWYKDRGATVHVFLSCKFRAMPVLGSCDATYGMSTGYDTYDILNLSNFPLTSSFTWICNENLTEISCLHNLTSRRPHGIEGYWQDFGLRGHIAAQYLGSWHLGWY